MMTQEEATRICNELAEDTGLTGSLAVHTVLRDLHQIANNSSSPLVQIEALELLIALANGPEDSVSAEDIAWRAYVQELAREIFSQAEGTHK